MNEIKKQKFSELIKEQSVIDALASDGITESSIVQSMTIPPAIAGEDLVVAARTGSGKTIAFAVPVIVNLLKSEKKAVLDEPFAIIVTPTRELAQQIAEVFELIAPEVAPVTLIGGVPYSKQQTQMDKDTRVVVGTPGRILDSIDRGDLNLSKVSMYVLDEADEMFSIGFLKDVEDIIKETPESAQGLFVSATISDEVVNLAKNYLQEGFAHLDAEDKNEEPANITHLYCDVGDQLTDKPEALSDFILHTQPANAIIFCNTKSETELVEQYLRRRGFDARRLNSDLDQKKRSKIMQKIKAKELRFLVATDIAARGIDISALELVVNFSLNQQAESYVHRTGRTGRAGNSGTALSLVSPLDFIAFKNVKELGVPFEKTKLPTKQEIAAAETKILNTYLDSLLSKKTEDQLATLKAFGETCLKSFADQSVAVGLLATHLLEHRVSEKVVSLEEELGPDNDRPSHNGKSNYKSERRPRR